MASQTDKKEEFRKYLEKSNVLAILTTILTDLFEMEQKPEDPGLYLYRKFGDSLKKNPAANLSAGQGHPEQPRKDAAMTDSAPATAINEAPLKVATPPQAAMTAVPAKTEAATLPESTAPASSNVMSTGTGELIPAETQSQPIVGSQPLGAQVSAEPQPTSQPDPNSTSPPNAPAPATVVPTPNPAPVQ